MTDNIQAIQQVDSEQNETLERESAALAIIATKFYYSHFVADNYPPDFIRPDNTIIIDDDNRNYTHMLIAPTEDVFNHTKSNRTTTEPFLFIIGGRNMMARDNYDEVGAVAIPINEHQAQVLGYLSQMSDFKNTVSAGTYLDVKAYLLDYIDRNPDEPNSLEALFEMFCTNFTYIIDQLNLRFNATDRNSPVRVAGQIILEKKTKRLDYGFRLPELDFISNLQGWLNKIYQTTIVLPTLPIPVNETLIKKTKESSKQKKSAKPDPMSDSENNKHKLQAISQLDQLTSNNTAFDFEGELLDRLATEPFIGVELTWKHQQVYPKDGMPYVKGTLSLKNGKSVRRFSATSPTLNGFKQAAARTAIKEYGWFDNTQTDYTPGHSHRVIMPVLLREILTINDQIIPEAVIKPKEIDLNPVGLKYLENLKSEGQIKYLTFEYCHGFSEGGSVYVRANVTLADGTNFVTNPIFYSDRKLAIQQAAIHAKTRIEQLLAPLEDEA